MNLNGLSLDTLLELAKKEAEKERHALLEALHLLIEVERRRAFVALGHASLWEYAIKELKYSENTAFQRISAMRALRGNPELGEAILSGALSIATVSHVQNVLRAEQQQGYRTYPESRRMDLFKSCENKNSKEVSRLLADFSALSLRVQKARVITDNRTEISFIAEPALVDKMRRVRDLSVARLRSPSSVPELVGLMSEVTLDKIDPLRKPVRKSKAPIVDDPAPSDTVPAAVRTRIWKEFEGQCSFVHAETGARCGSTFGLEIEHCKPQSMGGSSRDLDNLRLLCRQHNQWEAIQAYGQEKMDPYLNSKKDK
jgi:hypothetical protein